MKQIPDEIKEGMKLLDQEVPGWRGKVDPNWLIMNNCTHCILGQLFGNYSDGADALGLSDFEGQHYGFELTVGMSWEELTQAWKEALVNEQD